MNMKVSYRRGTRTAHQRHRRTARVRIVRASRPGSPRALTGPQRNDGRRHSRPSSSWWSWGDSNPWPS